MNNFNNLMEFKKKYVELLEIVIVNNQTNIKLQKFKENVTIESINLIANRFVKLIESDKKLQKMFLERNERIFSEKNNLKLIPNFNMKTFLAKLDDNKYCWECIQLLYAIYKTGTESNKSYVNSIIQKIEACQFSNSNSTSNNVSYKKDNGSQVDNIIMDIAGTLRNNLVSSSKSNHKVNPIENMIKTSQMISEKYGNDLKSGKISMNDMFQSLGKMMSTIDETTQNDEELQNLDVSDMGNTSDILNNIGLSGEDGDFDPSKLLNSLGAEGGFNPADLLKSVMGDGEQNGEKGFNPADLLSSVMGGGSEQSDGGFNPTNLLGKIFSGNNTKNKEKLTEKQIKEMEEFYANVDTNQLDNNIVDMTNQAEVKNVENNETTILDKELNKEEYQNENNLEDILDEELNKKEYQDDNINNLKEFLDNGNLKDISDPNNLKQLNNLFMNNMSNDEKKVIEEMTNNIVDSFN